MFEAVPSSVTDFDSDQEMSGEMDAVRIDGLCVMSLETDSEFVALSESSGVGEMLSVKVFVFVLVGVGVGGSVFEKVEVLVSVASWVKVS